MGWRMRGRKPISVRPTAQVVAPAIALARLGVQLSPGQRTFMHLVGDLLDLTRESAGVFDEAGRTGRYVNEGYADLLEAIGAGQVRGLADHDIGDALLVGSQSGGGLLTRADLESYRAYRRDALARFVAAPPSPLEQREKLEQLRALEMGMIIRADSIADFPKGVDSPPDLEAARAVLAKR